MNRLLILPLLIYLQFLYLIGAYRGRSKIDDQILWTRKKLESYGHKLDYSKIDYFQK